MENRPKNPDLEDWETVKRFFKSCWEKVSAFWEKANKPLVGGNPRIERQAEKYKKIIWIVLRPIIIIWFVIMGSFVLYNVVYVLLWLIYSFRAG